MWTWLLASLLALLVTWLVFWRKQAEKGKFPPISINGVDKMNNPVVPAGAAFLGDDAVVLGGSMAGLSVACVLAKYFKKVTIVERDELPSTIASFARPSVPQYSHIHLLLGKALAFFETHLPGYTKKLISAGCHPSPIHGGDSILFNNSTFMTERGVCEEPSVQSSLPVLVHGSRRAYEVTAREELLRQYPNVHIVRGTAMGLLHKASDASIAPACVTGVMVRMVSEVAEQQKQVEVHGDLVVDCMGRTGATNKWMAASFGVEAPFIEAVPKVTYTSTTIRRPSPHEPAFEGEADWNFPCVYALRRSRAALALVERRVMPGMGMDEAGTEHKGADASTTASSSSSSSSSFWRGACYQFGFIGANTTPGPDTPPTRLSFLCPGEAGIWQLSLATWFGERPALNRESFLEHLRLHEMPEEQNIVYQYASHSQFLSPITQYKIGADRAYQWDKVVHKLPQRWIPLGDNVCSLNPSNGQGVSSACRQAELLDVILSHVISADKEGALSLQDGLTHYVSLLPTAWQPAWDLASGLDFRMQHTKGTRPYPTWLKPVVELLNRCADRAVAAAGYDPAMWSLLSQVFNLYLTPLELLKCIPRGVWLYYTAVPEEGRLKPSKVYGHRSPPP